MTDFSNSHRMATVVLMDADGAVLGRLAPVRLSVPWLQETADLVSEIRQRYSISVTILRLLTQDDTGLPVRLATYLAQVTSGKIDQAALTDWSGEINEHPLRLPYAMLDGPRADLEWAETWLAEHGFGTLVETTQIRTWNLSSIWRLKTESRVTWLKCVPPFFRHEGAMLKLLAGEAVPGLLAHDNHRILMSDIPGEDCYNATTDQMRRMIACLVDLQWRTRTLIPEMVSLGVPDSTSTTLVADISSVINRHLSSEQCDHRATLESFRDSLNERLDRISASGIPDTLVHGDFHPGNWRGNGLELTILDWGDCSIGNPLLDMPAMLERAGEDTPALTEFWIRCWQSRLPDADVSTALSLSEPVAEARRAAVYQMFLDNIEPSERTYHDSDPAHCLHQVARLLSSE